MIGPKTLEKMILMTAEQIGAHRELIDKAFCKADDGKLKVSIGIDLSVSEVKPGGIDVDTTISFVAKRVKDKVSSTVVENQADLPLVDKIYPLKDLRMEQKAKIHAPMKGD